MELGRSILSIALVFKQRKGAMQKVLLETHLPLCSTVVVFPFACVLSLAPGLRLPLRRGGHAKQQIETVMNFEKVSPLPKLLVGTCRSGRSTRYPFLLFRLLPVVVTQILLF